MTKKSLLAGKELNFEHIDCYEQGCLSNIKNRMANSVDPDEMACYKLSHLDLHCLQNYL